MNFKYTEFDLKQAYDYMKNNPKISFDDLEDYMRCTMSNSDIEALKELKIGEFTLNNNGKGYDFVAFEPPNINILMSKEITRLSYKLFNKIVRFETSYHSNGYNSYQLISLSDLDKDLFDSSMQSVGILRNKLELNESTIHVTMFVDTYDKVDELVFDYYDKLTRGYYHFYVGDMQLFAQNFDFINWENGLDYYNRKMKS